MTVLLQFIHSSRYIYSFLGWEGCFFCSGSAGLIFNYHFLHYHWHANLHLLFFSKANNLWNSVSLFFPFFSTFHYYIVENLILQPFLFLITFQSWTAVFMHYCHYFSSELTITLWEYLIKDINSIFEMTLKLNLPQGGCSMIFHSIIQI